MGFRMNFSQLLVCHSHFLVNLEGRMASCPSLASFGSRKGCYLVIMNFDSSQGIKRDFEHFIEDLLLLILFFFVLLLAVLEYLKVSIFLVLLTAFFIFLTLATFLHFLFTIMQLFILLQVSFSKPQLQQLFLPIHLFSIFHL